MTWKCYAEANLATVHWHKKHNIKYSFFPQSCNRNELKLTSCQSCRDFQIVLGYLCIKDVNSLSMFISCWRISKKLFSKDVNDIFARSGSYCLFNTAACIDINSALLCVIRNAIKILHKLTLPWLNHVKRSFLSPVATKLGNGDIGLPFVRQSVLKP